MNLCGHATLAASWFLDHVGEETPLHFHTRSGKLTVEKNEKGFTLDFPSQGKFSKYEKEIKLEGLSIIHQSLAYDDLILEVNSSENLKKWKPDFNLINQFDVRGVIITAKDESGEYDFISRFFAPRVGVNEDPVTGSAHCKLVPYWNKKLDKKDFKAFQASKRGGSLLLSLESNRVKLTGSAKCFSQGNLSTFAS